MIPEEENQKLTALLTQDFEALFHQGQKRQSHFEHLFGIDSRTSRYWSARLLRIRSFLFLRGIEIDCPLPSDLAKQQEKKGQ